MSYKVKLAKNAKVNGKRYKVGETVEGVSEELFEELEGLELVDSFEQVEASQDVEGLPDYKKITADQIKERLVSMGIDFEGVTEKKDLYALLVPLLTKVGE